MSPVESSEVVTGQYSHAWWASNVGSLVRPDAYVAVLLRDGSPVCALAYDECNGRNVMAHIWSNGKWATRDRILNFMAMPFDVWGVARVTAKVESTNEKARALLERLGWVLEAVLSGAGNPGDLMFYRFGRRELDLLRDRLRKESDGKLETTARA